MKYVNITTIVLVVFTAYVLHSVYIISSLFKPPKCKAGSAKCISPYYKTLLNEKFSVWIVVDCCCTCFDSLFNIKQRESTLCACLVRMVVLNARVSVFVFFPKSRVRMFDSLIPTLIKQFFSLLDVDTFCMHIWYD